MQSDDLVRLLSSLAVVRKLRRLVKGMSTPHADLWGAIHEDVAAHRDISNAVSALEERCFQHNGFADRAAAPANEQRPAMFWDLLRRHVAACIQVDK